MYVDNKNFVQVFCIKSWNYEELNAELYLLLLQKSSKRKWHFGINFLGILQKLFLM